MLNKFICALATAGVLLTSCNSKPEAKTEKPVDVPVVTIQSRPLSIDHLYVSDIHAIRNVDLCSKISGYLEGIYVDEGQKVKKGQLLFRISDNEYRAAVAKTRAILNTIKAEERVAEVEYERVKLLTDKNIVSKTELELAASKLKAAAARTEEAKSDLDNAVHKLSYTTVMAPFDGVVDRIPLKVGSLLSEGTLITSVSDISEMYAYFDVSENEYLAYKRALADSPMEHSVVNLVLADGRNYEYTGKVETVVSEFDQNTGSISFRAKFPNPRHLLKHKATGKVKLASKVELALVVPQKSTFEIQDKNYVYVLDEANVVKMKSFVPSGRIDQYYIVESGLDAGDRIVYEGIQDLKEGMKVVPKQLQQGSGVPSVAAY